MSATPPFVSSLGLLGCLAAAAWLACAAGLMALAPARALALLARAGSSRAANTLEQGLRLLAGLALLARAPDARWPDAIMLMGGFLAATSVLLLILPLAPHAAYARWWAARLSPATVRALSLPTLALAALLAIAALGPSGG